MTSSKKRPGEREPPGYPLDDVTVVDSEQQFKAFGHELRRRILAELLGGAASIEMLARALRRPKGTVGYHVRVLADAGLIRVVEEVPVRGVTEKLYGRTARTVEFAAQYHLPAARAMVRQAGSELTEDPDGVVTLRHARMPRHRALEFRARLIQLSLEFIETPSDEDVPWGLLLALYPAPDGEPAPRGAGG